MTSPDLARVLADAYGNYVVQSILTITSGPMHTFVVDAIRPHSATLKGTAHGKRILQRIGGVGAAGGAGVSSGSAGGGMAPLPHPASASAAVMVVASGGVGASGMAMAKQ